MQYMWRMSIDRIIACLQISRLAESSARWQTILHERQISLRGVVLYDRLRFTPGTGAEQCSESSHEVRSLGAEGKLKVADGRYSPFRFVFGLKRQAHTHGRITVDM